MIKKPLLVPQKPLNREGTFGHLKICSDGKLLFEAKEKIRYSHSLQGTIVWYVTIMSIYCTLNFQPA